MNDEGKVLLSLFWRTEAPIETLQDCTLSISFCNTESYCTNLWKRSAKEKESQRGRIIGDVQWREYRERCGVEKAQAN